MDHEDTKTETLSGLQVVAKIEEPDDKEPVSTTSKNLELLSKSSPIKEWEDDSMVDVCSSDEHYLKDNFDKSNKWRNDDSKIGLDDQSKIKLKYSDDIQEDPFAQETICVKEEIVEEDIYIFDCDTQDQIIVGDIFEENNRNELVCDAGRYLNPTPVENKPAMSRNGRLATGLYACQICAFSSNLNKKFVRHMGKNHADMKPFTCDTCTFRTNWATSLMCHVKNVHGPKAKRYKCKECSFNSNSAAILSQHELNIHGVTKPFACKFCPYRCKSRSGIDTHVNGVHSKSNLLQCKRCSYTSFWHNNILRHRRTKHLS